MNTPQNNESQLVTAGKLAENWQNVEDYKANYDAARPFAVDMKLTSGRWAFNCWTKVKPPHFFYFLEMDKPYRQYNEHEVAAIRPAE